MTLPKTPTGYTAPDGSTALLVVLGDTPRIRPRVPGGPKQTISDEESGGMAVYVAGDWIRVPKWDDVAGTVRSVFPDGDLSVACEGTEWIETQLSPGEVEPLS